ncbi:MAG: molecular chaperone HtpG [Eubacteriales bacterium]|nr:molecular chaperone HtpG [Eubacteriales bacterium]
MDDFKNIKGSLSINSENIFPIIKKWLYQDHDIFYRELISNGCDAVTKLKKLALMGEYNTPQDEKYRIDVTVDPDEKTITFSDNGLGMTEEEVNNYINQVAFSGAADFLEKYKDKANEDQIIGHFGLGFYSAFMVADKVTIDTCSYRENAIPVHWESEGGTEFTITRGEKSGHGTDIKLYLNEDSVEFCNEYKAYEVISKYCSFMPVEIYLHDVKREAEEAKKKAEEAAKKAEERAKAAEEGKTVDNSEEEEVKNEPRPLNDTNPLWNENPSQVKEEQYKEFYRKVFNDYKEPLFWIHLNMDYPFNLKGILYFPKVNTQYDNLEGRIKLYNNQVFIADNIKEVIPEYLMLLKGVIDCPDLPLNVSRSALQNDGFVKKISDYITKKVSDKLSGMFKTDRENYEKYWDDISPFIKYGCIKDVKFGDKMKDAIIMKDLSGKYLMLSEYLASNSLSEAKDENGETVQAETIEPESEGNKESEENKENEKKNVYYVTDENEQGQYIRMFKEAGLNAVILNQVIDTPFISFMEQKNENIDFVRIDSDLTKDFKDEGELSEEEQKSSDRLCEIFKKALENDKLDIKVEKLKDTAVASMMTMSEEGRRMQEMMKMYAMYGMGDMQNDDQTLVINANNDLVKRLLTEENEEYKKDIAIQLYDMALLSRGGLSQERMTAFIKRSQKLMMDLK